MSDVPNQRPTIAICASLACAWEVLAPKPGNVHPGAAFSDATVADFLTSGILIGDVLQRAETKRIGELVLESVLATSRWAATNTNLGLILLLAPLAKAAIGEPTELKPVDIHRCLGDLQPPDAADVYQAIRLANPGGLGESDKWDVNQTPPEDLLAAMSHAASRDTIAREYRDGFPIVFGQVVPSLDRALQSGQPLSDAIVQAFLEVLSEVHDSLIVRKCGIPVAAEASERAREVLQAFDMQANPALLEDFDHWLREDGNRRNPGTTADLIGAGLFVALFNGVIRPPMRW